MVRVQGVVTARWGQTVYLYDGVQGASVLSREAAINVNPGEIVDALGYPALGDPAHMIVDAIFRQLGTAPIPEPKSVSVREALSGTVDGDLIRLEGRLIELQKTAEQSTLHIDSGGTVYTAILPGGPKAQSLASLRDGSRIQLTGICVISETIESRHFRLPRAFQLLLRSPADVVVIESPTWLTPAHAMLMLAFVLAGMLAVLAWVFALRMRVAQQTDLLHKQADRLRESEEVFRHMALHDALTGLATRLLLKDRMNLALESARRNVTELALLMVDLDKFKEVNDGLGHEAGDEVLRVTAGRLLKSVRVVDTVARLGGDEFVVLLPDLKRPQAAERIAANLVKTLAVPIPFNGVDVKVSASIGVFAAPALGLDGEAFMRNADTALYDAKAKGRNCFQVFVRGKVPDEASDQSA
jgi:diguanylate cyclase (GGDEF)-like protein